MTIKNKRNSMTHQTAIPPPQGLQKYSDSNGAKNANDISELVKETQPTRSIDEAADDKNKSLKYTTVVRSSTE